MGGVKGGRGRKMGGRRKARREKERGKAVGKRYCNQNICFSGPERRKNLQVFGPFFGAASVRGALKKITQNITFRYGII